ncbi:hypothetical protein AB0H58_15005 [Nocardia neocaledoniensis]|uniref:hypothetical protein n=1 Tax=Nocardia neocaledoniensis TaxID=236511 RepID=UPI0033C3A0C5
MYGSKTSAYDKTVAAAASVDAASAQAYFDLRGWDFSEDLLGTYLGNNDEGFIYEISSGHYDRVMATRGARQAIALCLDEIKDQARQNPQIGVTRELTSAWLGVQPGDDDDIDNALGHYDVAVSSDTTVSDVDGALQAEIVYKSYVYEFYNFDKDSETSPAGVVNNEMRHLEEAGWARSFRVHGEATFQFRQVEKL